jgi:hypothetical protein
MVLSAVLEAAAAAAPGTGATHPSGYGGAAAATTALGLAGGVCGVVHLSFSSASGPELVLRALEQVRVFKNVIERRKYRVHPYPLTPSFRASSLLS